MYDVFLPPGGLVSRPNLLQSLNQGLACRLILVVAPAGYGKTTLVSNFKSQPPENTGGRLSNLKSVWLSLDENDNDPAHLLSRLNAGVRSALPDPTSLPAVDEFQSSLSYPLALVFRNASEITQTRWLLVLDDYHLITNVSIHQAFDTLLGLPTWPVHLVIASRTLPPLTAIARLRVEGCLVELDEHDLRFSPAEAAELLAAGGLHLKEQELVQVTERTEGWAAALRLVCQAAQRETGSDLATILGRMSDESQLFDYLAGQVLDRQPAEVRRFLTRTALLPYLSVELCNAFLGSADTSAILDYLERNHLFITRQAQGAGRRYRYHTLFAEFLCRCLEQEEGAQVVRDWHRRAAQCFLERQVTASADQRTDEYIAAINHLLAAQDWPIAADAIETVVKLLDWGQLTHMEAWFDRLPSNMLATRPRLLLALGLLRERQSRWSEALDALMRAERLLLAGGEPGDRGRVLQRQAWIRHRQGSYAQAEQLCQLALADLSGEQHNQLSPHLLREQAEVYRLLGASSFETGDFVHSEKYSQQALQLFRELGDRAGEALTLSNLANFYADHGRLAQAIEFEQMALCLFDEMGSYRVCNSFIGLSDTFRLRGEYEKARALAERALQLTDTHQDPLWRGYALFVLGHLHRERGNPEAARICYDESRTLGEELREPTLLCEPRRGLALLALDEGDQREARRHAQAAVQQVQSVGYRILEGRGLTTLGLIMDRSGDTRQAEVTWGEALRLFQVLEAAFDLATVYLYLADLCRRDGRDEEALTHFERCLSLSQQYSYDFLFTVRERSRAIPLLINALAETSEVSGQPKVGTTSEVARLLGLIGQDAVEPLLSLIDTAPKGTQTQAQVFHLLGEIGDERAVPILDRLRRRRSCKTAVEAALQRIAEQPAPTLRVLALGSFQVLRGHVPVPQEAWQQRRKARSLLLYLLTNRHRPVPRDELIESLWPDLAPDSAGLALNTTFSDLRKLLEPYLGKGMSSRYVTREGDCYSFNTQSDTWYDAQAFEQTARQGHAASRQAVELYRDDFLPEEPYADWAVRERERLRSLYLNTLTLLLDQQVQQGAWREGIDLARRILDREPWLEEVWRALMTCYAMLGRRSEALQAYLACERNLRQELDVAPAPQTRALYEQLKA